MRTVASIRLTSRVLLMTTAMGATALSQQQEHGPPEGAMAQLHLIDVTDGQERQKLVAMQGPTDDARKFDVGANRDQSSAEQVAVDGTGRGACSGGFDDPKLLELDRKFPAWQMQPPQGGAKHTPTSSYQRRGVEGWDVLLNPELVKDRKLCDAVVKVLAQQLFQITRVVPAGPLKKLQRVPIWVEVDDPDSAGACYHEDRDWLVEHGINPDKARAVEVSDASAFLTWTDEPCVVLHELAHAYHHQYIDNDPNIRRCYENAKAGSTLKNVLRASGRHERHYALSSEREYFAEMTEAFFGTNDYFPFVRAELKEADPDMHAVLKNLWGVD